MIKKNDYLTTYSSHYRWIGGLIVFFSLPAIATFFVVPTMGKLVVAPIASGLVGLGLYFIFRIKRKWFSHDSRSVISEAKWPFRKWSRKSESIESFVEIHVHRTSLHDRPGMKGNDTGIVVRVRHRLDSRNSYPGQFSWILASYSDWSDKEKAFELAQYASEKTGLPLRDDVNA